MAYYLRNELTGDVSMVGSDDPPAEGTRFRHANGGGFTEDDAGSFVVISDEAGRAAMIADPADDWYQAPAATDDGRQVIPALALTVATMWAAFAVNQAQAARAAWYRESAVIAAEDGFEGHVTPSAGTPIAARPFVEVAS
jgi:hypothetical protein